MSIAAVRRGPAGWEVLWLDQECRLHRARYGSWRAAADCAVVIAGLV